MTDAHAVTPKRFQQATIRAALKALMPEDGPRRYLVADEAGLGKTIVARGIVEAMANALPQPLTVFYVCSNQSIVTQNVQQLVAFLPEDERACAMAHADRPSLLPLFKHPAHPKLRVYSLTPGTAYSGQRRSYSRGKVQERALACALLEMHAGGALPWLRSALAWNAAAFGQCLVTANKVLAAGTESRNGQTAAFRRAFRSTLRAALGVDAGARLAPKLEALANASPIRLTSICRNSLAAAALSSLHPDLVVFDEFQKFRDLMRDAGKGAADQRADAAQQHIVRVLTGACGSTRLLLLSATPYEATRMRSGKEGAPEESDFFEVLDFLHENLSNGVDYGREVRTCLARIEDELRQGTPLSSVACAARARVTELLRRVMCRTERPKHVRDAAEVRPVEVQEGLVARDIKGFRAFAEWLNKADRHWAVPLWTSVPLPVQTLGAKYQCWQNGSPSRRPSAELRLDDIADWRAPKQWPSFKTRGLLEALPPQRLAMPWVRPSREWWPLGQGWERESGEDAVDGKLLVFSRFAAVPGSLSAVTSFNLECQLLSSNPRKGAYKDWVKPKFVKPHRSPAVFQLFYMSKLLAQLDPLANGLPGSEKAAHKCMAQALQKLLAERQIHVGRAKRRKPLATHVLLIALAKRFGHWESESLAWIRTMATSEEGATEAEVVDVLRRWEKLVPERLSSIDAKRELGPLVQLALASPAVALGRALQRHWTDALSDYPVGKAGTPHQLVQQLIVGPLRKYLDRPWFAAALETRRAPQFADALRRAVVEGNFEAVMDEHFWLLSKTSSDWWPKRLEELGAALSLTGGRTVIHERGKGSRKGRIRCHVALPLRQAKTVAGPITDEQPPPRPDQVRHAFNTPFWPMVLTTTSVGQEGLDFHPWCRSVAHWDPARGPVELEQREGRVARYAGLAIRRALAVHAACSPGQCPGSVWTAIGHLAEGLADSQELQPWWRVEGAKTLQFYFPAVGSREVEQRRRLERSRALYRMVFGVSEPEPLLEELEPNETIDPKTALEASLHLGAWDLEQQDSMSALKELDATPLEKQEDRSSRRVLESGPVGDVLG